MSYGNYSQNPYQQGPATEGGYGQYNPYDGQGQGQGQGQYELQNYGQQEAYGQQAPGATLSQSEFLNQTTYVREQIRSLTGDVENISTLHMRALGSTDPSAGRELEDLVARTQLKNTEIKDRIKTLERDVVKTTDGSRATKTTQLNSLKSTFKKELEEYQRIEREYQQRYRAQIARQYRIVNPDATEEEVQEATNADWGNEGVFQTALRTNRSGQASTVLGAVRARHNELVGIEQTLIELNQLFQDLAVLVEQQEPVIDAAETNAHQTVENLDQGNKQVEGAVKHAWNARKLKWWCLGISVLIVLIIAIVVGVVVGLNKKNSG